MLAALCCSIRNKLNICWNDKNSSLIWPFQVGIPNLSAISFAYLSDNLIVTQINRPLCFFFVVSFHVYIFYAQLKCNNLYKKVFLSSTTLLLLQVMGILSHNCNNLQYISKALCIRTAIYFVLKLLVPLFVQQIAFVILLSDSLISSMFSISIPLFRSYS